MRIKMTLHIEEGKNNVIIPVLNWEKTKNKDVFFLKQLQMWVKYGKIK